MGWLLLGWTLAAVLLLPLHLRMDVHLGVRKLLRLRVDVLGLQREWLAELIATPQGHRLLVAGKGGHPRSMAADDMRAGPADRVLKLLGDSKRIRRFLLRHTHAGQLDAQLLLHTSSAAATALLTGAVQSAVSCMPPRWRAVSRVRVLPDFLRDHSTLQARCIFRLRLGTILITACLLLAALAAQAINREAQRIWNTPSEN